MPRWDTPAGRLAGLLILTLAWLVLAAASLFSVEALDDVSLLWLPAALAATSCYLLGPRMALLWFAVGTGYHFFHGDGLWISLACGLGGALQPLLPVAVLRRIRRRAGGDPLLGAGERLLRLRALRFLALSVVTAAVEPSVRLLAALALGDPVSSTLGWHWLAQWAGQFFGLLMASHVCYHVLGRALGHSGLDSWRLSLSLMLIALGPLAALVHQLSETGVLLRLPGDPSPESLQLMITLGVAGALMVAGGVMLRSHGMIDRLRQRREALAASEARLRMAMDATGVSIWEWDRSGGGMRYSPEFERSMGYQRGELRGDREGRRQLIHPDDLERVEALLSRQVIGGRDDYRDLELRLRSKTEGWLWVSVGGRVTERDAAGRPMRMVGTSTDIDQRKHLELALSQAERESRAIMDASPAMICSGTVQPEMRIDYMSAKVRQMLGYEPEDCLAPGWWPSILHPDERASVMAQVQTLVREGSCSIEHRVADRRGDWHWVRAELVAVRDAIGHVSGWVGAVLDISHARHIEQQLRESQKLEAIGQLTGGLAHDFNNLLGVVIGNLELLGERLPTQDAVHRQHRTALDAALRGAEVTRSLLAVARRQPLQVQVEDLNELVEQILPLVRSSAGSAITVVSQLSEGTLPVPLDAAGLSNAVLNVVINARDALAGWDGPKRVVLRTRRRRIQASDGVQLTPGWYAVLEASDTGPGMSEAVRTRAFEPFFTTKPTGRGTGLGLAMVRGLAEQLGGTARLDSSPGAGTTVSLYLPLEVQRQAQWEQAEAMRLEALDLVRILDTPHEAAYDALAAQAAQACATPIAMVALLDEQRVWFKAGVGLALRELPREDAPCVHEAQAAGQVREVADTWQDARMSAATLVLDAPHLRFCASATLNDGAGHVLGSLCVADRVPRTLTPAQRERLLVLAAQVSAMLQSRRPHAARPDDAAAIRAVTLADAAPALPQAGPPTPTPALPQPVPAPDLPPPVQGPAQAAAAEVPPAASPAGPEPVAPAPSTALRVLVVDDEQGLAELAGTWLRARGHAVREAHSAAEAMQALQEQPFDILFSDVVMPGGMDGLGLAREAARLYPGLRILLTSGYSRALTEAHEMPWPLLNKPYRRRELLQALDELPAAAPADSPKVDA